MARLSALKTSTAGTSARYVSRAQKAAELIAQLELKHENGAAQAEADPVAFFNDHIDLGSVSMLGVAIGAPNPGGSGAFAAVDEARRPKTAAS